MIHKNRNIIYITNVLNHIIYIIHIIYLTHIIFITHVVKLIFKAYKKNLLNIFFYIFLKYFFPIYKNVNRILSKKQKKGFQKRLVKGTKIFLKKKKKGSVNMVINDIKIF